MNTSEYDIDLMQKGQWLLHHMNGNPFNRCVYLNINNLSVEVLREAIIEVIAGHECFRTSFAFSGGVLKHRVHSLDNLNTDEVLKVNFWDQCRGQIDLEAIYENEMQKPFDLNKCPLIRMNFWFCGSDSYLFCTMHHAIYDTESFPIFYEQLSLLYEKHLCQSEDKSTEDHVQYKAYFDWKKKKLGEVRAEVKKFWAQNFNGIAIANPPTPEADATYSRGKAEIFRDKDLALLQRVLPTEASPGGVYRFCIPPDLTDKIKSFQEKYGCTTYITILTSFSILLAYTYSRPSNMITFAVSDRGYIEHDNIIGWLVSSATFLGRADEDNSLEDVLEYSVSEFWRSFDHRFYPVDKILEDNNLFVPYHKIIPIYLNYHVTKEKKKEFASGEEPGIETTANHDLNCKVNKYNNLVEIECVYSKAVFSSQEISELFENYLTIIHSLLEDPKKTVKDLFQSFYCEISI